MGKPLVKLMQSSYVLDLNDQARYWLSQDFVPPNAALVPVFGAAGENYSGSDLLVEQIANRTFSFTVNLMGASSGEIDRAVRDVRRMLRRADIDSTNPLYLAYKADANLPEPLWGQFGAMLRYEIVWGEAILADGYMVGVRRATDINLVINLTLKPVALGKQQRLCTATGGIIEDTIGTVDGQSRGLIVPPTTTNLFFDPSFEVNPITTNWSVFLSGGGSGTAIYDTQHVLFGVGALKVIKGTSNYLTIYQSVTTSAAAHTISAYIYKSGGGTVTSSDFQFIIDGNNVVPDSITAVGNGWYRAVKTASETAAAHQTGIYAAANVWVDGAQFEQKAYVTPFGDGSQLGCAWSDAAYSSTSIRTAATVKIATASDTLQTAPMTIGFVFKTGALPVGTNTFVFDLRDGSHTSAPYCYIFSDTSKFLLVYNGYTAQPASNQTSNTVYIVHCVITANGDLSIYINGVLGQTVSSGGTAALGANLFIGSDYTGASQANNTLYDFTLFDFALTATQVADDYANLAAVVADDQRVGAIPWLWTKDGDNVVDLLDDSTRDNWCVSGGIPGTFPAITQMIMNGALFHTASANSYLIMSHHDMKQFVNPIESTYMECSGTATGTYDSGSAVETISVSSAAFSDPANYGPDATLYFRTLAGREIYVLASLLDAGTNLTARIRFQMGSLIILTDYKSIVPSDPINCAAFVLGPILLPDFVDDFDTQPTIFTPLYICPELKRSTGGAANVSLDFYEILPRPLVLIGLNGNGSSIDGCIQDSNRKTCTLTAAGARAGIAPLTGDGIELLPDRINVVLFNHITSETHAHYESLSLTIQIIPRWGLL